MAKVEDHPLEGVLEWLPELDFGVMEHGWTQHGRDYLLVVQNAGSTPGTFELAFTHCVQAEFETRVRDDVWPMSWDDVFTDYQAWIDGGEPPGFVWGVNWSNAYPGFVAVQDSESAASWTERLGMPMYETTLETNQFFLRLVHHAARSRKLNDETATIEQAHIPLKRRTET